MSRVDRFVRVKSQQSRIKKREKDKTFIFLARQWALERKGITLSNILSVSTDCIILRFCVENEMIVTATSLQYMYFKR
jgi:hypothetical protein